MGKEVGWYFLNCGLSLRVAVTATEGNKEAIAESVYDCEGRIREMITKIQHC